MGPSGRFHRVVWSIVNLALIGCTIFIVLTLWRILLVNPTVTSMVSSTYPVNKIPFPAVSICSINKVSKKRARTVARRIANKTGRDLEKITSYMQFVGQLHDFDFQAARVSELLDFQNILDSLKISVIDLAKSVSVPCKELLRSCYWRSEKVDCSSVFSMMLTYHGFCCVFNYHSEEVLTTDAGIESGLYVSAANYPQDYSYTTLSMPGVVAYVFRTTDYPDKPAGGVSEVLTKPSSENFIEIVPTLLTTVPDVSSYPPEKRQCVFPNERTTVFGGIYSQSNCNVACRTKSVEAICKCIPFMIPFSNASTVCTLADIPCLSRYRDKWNSYYPAADVALLLQKERQDSLHCEERCYPSCDVTSYEIQINSFPIFDHNKTIAEKNVTYIYVYYLDRFCKEFRQDVVYYWFEILSSFGGIFGIFVGWSMISMLHVVVHYSRKVVEKFVLSFD